MCDSYKVSIIVAVYNVENFIRRCVDSLLQQTYSNIEIILVDDGSLDKSGLICDEYARQDSRIVVIHKNNGGVSSARQTGLDAATGDFVIHADPDDYVDPVMVQELLTKAIESSADMVTCDFYYNNMYKSQGYTTEEELLRKLVNVQIICVCWNVLVRRAFICQHNISFSPIWLCYSEDFLFMCRLLAEGAKSVHVKKAFYHYVSDYGGSLTRKRTRKQLNSIVAVIKEIGGIVKGEEYDNFYIRKKYALQYAFYAQLFDEIRTLYPEVHDRLIAEGHNKTKYHIDRLLALALSGFPRLAFILERWHNYSTKFLNLIKFNQ